MGNAMTSPEGETSTRRRLLDVALGLFARHGFAGTSIRMVARGAELRESSIYNHFAGKEALYEAVIEQWGPAEFVERLKSAEYRALSDDPAAFFRLCGRHLVQRWGDPREHLFFELINKEGPTGSGRRRFHEALYHEEIAVLATYITGFSERCGLIAPSPQQTAMMFAAGLVHIRLEYFQSNIDLPDQALVQDAVDRFIDNFLATVIR